MMELLVFKAKASTAEELEMVRQAMSDVFGEEKRPMTNAEKQKAYRERRKVTESNATVTESNDVTEEEREEKEEVLPLSSPSSLPSSPSDSPINYPITPYNPPLPEEKGEREEDFGGSDGKRGELQSFGPHVKLSEKEFLRLQKDFGYEETMRMIRSMNDYIGEDPKLISKYRLRNHNLTLRNWKRMDDEKKAKQAGQEKRRETWAEVAARVASEKKAQQEVIDL